MSWNPNQAQDPNQPSQYGAGYTPPSQPNDPYSGQYGQQQGGYTGQQGGQQQGGYQGGQYGQQPSYQPPDGYNQQQGGYYGQPGQQPPYGQPQPGQQPPYGQQQFNAQQMLGSMVGGPSSQAQAPTSMGLQANIAAALSYLVGWVTGLIFFFVEKQNRYVRFSAAQSIIVFGAISVLSIVFGFIPFVGFILVDLLGLVALVAWIALVILSFQGREVRIPFVADYADKLLNRFPNT